MKEFAMCYRTVLCPSSLSVCDVGLLWPNGCMDHDETWHEGRPGPGPHCVRWGTSSPSQRAQPPIFGPCLLWPNGWKYQDVTWYGARPRPRRLCVRWGPRSPSPVGDTAAPTFRPMSVVAMQTARWIKMPLGREVGLRSGDTVRWEPCSPPKKGAQQPPTFRPMSIVTKRLDGSICNLVRR